MEQSQKTLTAKTAITFLMCEENVPEPLDYSAPALDLCMREKKRSPSPEGASQINVKREPVYIETPSSTYCFSSPASQDGSESSSDISVTSDHYSKLPNVPVTQRAKIPRPFKAYPKDPLSLAVGVATAEAIIGQDAAEAYAEFRKRMLAQVQATNAGTNKNMRRLTHHAINSNGDPSYWEKRRKNNEAAKRSRDARRAKEDEIAIRCAFLEQENLKLRYEVATLRNETDRLRNLMYN